MVTVAARMRVVLLAACAAWVVPVGASTGQPASSATDTGLLPLIPPEAVFFVERRGHQAVRAAFLESNFGRLAMDEAVNQFVHDSRRRIGRMIVANALNLTDEQELERHRVLLHELLKPFWHRPAAMFVVMDPSSDGRPSVGFLCQPGNEYDKSAGEALAALMASAGKKKAGRQEFTHTTGMFRWEGMVMAGEAMALPAEAEARAKALKGRDLFMVSRSMSLLTAVTSVSAAEALEKAVSRAAKDENQSVKTVLGKTAMKDWAFRWYFDMRAAQKFAAARGGGEAMGVLNGVLNLDGIRGAGGTGGYVDKVYARLTYVDAPDAQTGLTRLLKQGGSYKKGMSMTPSSAVITLAGELDAGEFTRMLQAIVMPPEPAGAAATQPRRRRSEPSKEVKAVIEQIRRLAEASDGHTGIFVTDLQGMAVGMMAGGPPVGMVVGLKDRAKAMQAIDELVKLAGPAPEDMPPDGMPQAGMPQEYRKVPIRYAGSLARFAILTDRVVIALGDGALKAAIDAALDRIGGFEPDSKAEALARSLGEGAGVFQIDLRAMVKLLWPMAIQVAQMEEAEFPFTSLPSTDKMVRMLGPEIAVLEPVPGGLMIRSRGTVPFATKMFLMSPATWIIGMGF
ncbi:MAG TPA: hypothetical protein VFJ30_07355 [Phycisphaerae bacterium]|nr:hypothetical protein [Phycisphaerae bacterium]